MLGGRHARQKSLHVLLLYVLSIDFQQLPCRVLTSHLLQEVDELAHVALVARRAEDVLLERPLLVQLQQHHLQRRIQGRESLGTNGSN